jgi:hypothetical protein
MKKTVFCLLLSVCAVRFIFPVSLEDLTDPGNAARLRSGGASVIETQLKNPVPKLLPRYEPLRQFVTGAAAELGPNVLVETLYLYKKPAPGSWSDVQRAGLFNRALAISTLAGIEYYSASRKAMRVFYETSRVIDGPETKRPIPDPLYARPPASLSIYARQKDLTFGDNIYRYDYLTSGGAFFFLQENLTAMSAGIVPAVGKNKRRSIMAVIDLDDSLLIYAASIAKTASVPGMGDRIGASFGNRAEAVIKWFTAQADGIFASR